MYVVEEIIHNNLQRQGNMKVKSLKIGQGIITAKKNFQKKYKFSEAKRTTYLK